MGFKVYDYKGGMPHKKIFGLPIMKKDNTLTLLFMGLPIIQRKTYFTQVTGGGDNI